MSPPALSLGTAALPKAGDEEGRAAAERGAPHALAKASRKVLSSSCGCELKLVARTTPARRAHYPSAQPNVSAAALLSCFLNKQRTDTN